MVKMQSISKQHGMAMISWFLVIVVVVLFVTFIIRLVPIYIDGFSVYESISAMETDSRLNSFGAKAVKKSLLRRLDINAVYSVTEEDIYVTKKSGKTIVEVDYEVRENLFGNLDFVVRFKKEVTVQ